LNGLILFGLMLGWPMGGAMARSGISHPARSRRAFFTAHLGKP